MRVLFVHLGREHLGIEYLASMLEREGHKVALSVDLGLFSSEDNVLYSTRLRKFFDETEVLLSEAKNFAPEVICFSPYTTTYQWSLRMARLLKGRTGAVTVFGGIHTTLVPDVVAGEEVVDFAIVGEGEEALTELIDFLERGVSVEKIANLWMCSGSSLISNPPRPPLRNLDELPPPKKSLFEPYVNFRDDYLIMASRGCIFNCTYCCESYLRKLYGGRFYRRRSAGSVISELRVMKERYGFREVMFNDAVFFAERNWLEEFLYLYRSEIGVPFRCFGQVKLMNDEVARRLKEAGCYAVEFGLQTINPDVKRRILRRTESIEDCERAFGACDNSRLHYDIDHMFGLPGESVEDHIEAGIFYSKLRYLNRLKCHNLSYFPRLQIVEEAVESGQLSSGEKRDIERGHISDFFHTDSIKDITARRQKDALQTLYKILPILPRSFTGWLLRSGKYRLLRYIPKPLVIMLQILVAFRGRDYRFLLYFKYYIFRLMRVTERKLER